MSTRFVLTALVLALSAFLSGCASTTTIGALPVVRASEDVPRDPLAVGYLSHIPPRFAVPQDDVGRLILREYGSLFVAGSGVRVPDKAVFRDEEDVAAFQETVDVARENIRGTTIELQRAAMQALKEAVSEAARGGLVVSPRGTRAGRRHYALTAELWTSRVTAGMKHWVALGKISAAEGKRVESLPPFDQVPEILGLEEKKLFFAKDLTKSILYSAAPPGASQHLSMLAVDIVQNSDPRVRAILAKHGWFQTVTSDLPHFTYLAATEDELPRLGLRSVRTLNRTFWVPDLPR